MQSFPLKESKQWPVICFGREEFSLLKQAVDPRLPVPPEGRALSGLGHHSSSALSGSCQLGSPALTLTHGPAPMGCWNSEPIIHMVLFLSGAVCLG